ncbi:hypothetical protein pVa21_015 [Vibrio phage pVa-21]|nr:hypothetical protein pVa21_015 [Vibrio phage pVa-21]
MANINNLDIQAARLMAAIRSTAPFSVRVLDNDTIALVDGKSAEYSYTMLKQSNDGSLSRSGIYYGKLTDARYLSKVAPLLFNGYYITADGVYGDFEGGTSRIVDFNNVLKSVKRPPHGYTSSMMLNSMYNTYGKHASNLSEIIYEYRNQMTMNGVFIRDGAITFNDQTHTAVHELIGDEHTEQTILEAVEELGCIKNPRDYQLLVDTFVDKQYVISEEHKRHLTRAMNAIMYIIRSSLTVESDEIVIIHGHRLPTKIFLTA